MESPQCLLCFTHCKILPDLDIFQSVISSCLSSSPHSYILHKKHHELEARGLLACVASKCYVRRFWSRGIGTRALAPIFARPESSLARATRPELAIQLARERLLRRLDAFLTWYQLASGPVKGYSENLFIMTRGNG